MPCPETEARPSRREEAKETQRRKQGRLLGTLIRNPLLMPATPRKGKEADFQPFISPFGADRVREEMNRADRVGDGKWRVGAGESASSSAF